MYKQDPQGRHLKKHFIKKKTNKLCEGGLVVRINFQKL